MSKRILVIDDEPGLLDIVEFALETQGFAVTTATNAEAGWQLLTSQHFDLVLLDVMLPGLNGIALCTRIRAHMDVPVVLLTARSDVESRVLGFEQGADDYVVKPFSPRELALRVEAILRRTVPESAQALLKLGDLSADLHLLQFWWQERRLELSEAEARLLQALAMRRGEIATWRELLNEVWSTTAPQGGRELIKTTVYRLRNRLESQGMPADSIEAVRGQGYRFAASVTKV